MVLNTTGLIKQVINKCFFDSETTLATKEAVTVVLGKKRTDDRLKLLHIGAREMAQGLKMQAQVLSQHQMPSPPGATLEAPKHHRDWPVNP